MTLVPLVAALTAPYVSFLSSYNVLCLVPVCFVGGAIMIARSPSSALAVLTELNAYGPMTKTLLGVTVVSDIALLVIFAITTSFTKAQCSNGSFEGTDIFSIFLALLLCGVLGFILGKILTLFMWIPFINSPTRGLLILPTGYLFFWASGWFAQESESLLGLQIAVEPLLLCLIAGTIASNESKNRRKYFLSVSV
jgi:Kef-type K+ transport system membrane component KefB